MLRENVHALHDLYVGYANKIISREFSTEKMVRTETVRESTDEYNASVRANRRNRTASFEAATNAGINLRAGEKVSYYIVGSDPHQPSFANARLYDDETEDPKDYNTYFYLKKLDEYANRFSDFFEPEDFHKIFSSEADSLFAVSLEGIKMKTIEIGAAETKIEEEESE